MRQNETQGFTLDGIEDAFFALDADWNFTFVSAEAEQLLGYAGTDLLGKNLWHRYPDAVGSIYDEKYRQAIQEQTSVSFEAYAPNSHVWYEFRAYPSFAGLSIYFRDITHHRQAEEALQISENRLGMAVEAAGVGWFYWDIRTDQLTWSERCKAIYGLSAGEETTVEHFQALVHPDDREWVERDVAEAIANRTDHNVEFKIVRPDGSIVWIAAKGRGGYDAAGNAVRFEGIVQDITERKRLEEALEAERQRVLQRERNIAEVLQAAMQPELPRIAPGLDLAFFFKAALEEASIGGDFADVFAVDHGRTALVVGDLSGKGLAAASQVATIRNMLRSFIYAETSLVQAVTKLNKVVVENNLLSGFVTLFAATYRAGDRALKFVSCGHEPGLIRRATTGRVEQMPPTGTVLGADEDASYQEQTLLLSRGDALLLYTDGLTEAGPDFQSFLNVEGMAHLFADSAAADATGLVTEIVNRVQQYATDGLRDDACLLAAVVG